MIKNYTSLIPEQKMGKKLDYTQRIKGNTGNEAHYLYDRAKKRLFDINNWHNLCAIASACFCLTDTSGNEKSGCPLKGDHIRIGIPGPKSIEGYGFDWVIIEEIQLSESSGNSGISFITVRPSENPFNRNGYTAHFFTRAATSTFIVVYDHETVTASYHGRNENTNIKETKGIIEKVRHIMIALGAKAGLSKVQWKLLIDNVLEKE